TASGDANSSVSNTGSSVGTAAFSFGTVTSSGGSSGAGLNSSTASSQSTYSFHRTVEDTNTSDQGGLGTTTQRNLGTFAGGSFNLGVVLSEQYAFSTFHVFSENSVTEDGTVNRYQTSSGFASFTNSASASVGDDRIDTFDGGASG